MSGIPKIRLVVQAHKGRVHGTGSKNSQPREFLVQGPSELVHIHVGVAGGRNSCEWSGVLRALFFDYLLEARQVGEGAKHWAALVRRHVALKLEGYQTCQARGLITGNITPHRLSWNIA